LPIETNIHNLRVPRIVNGMWSKRVEVVKYWQRVVRINGVMDRIAIIGPNPRIRPRRDHLVVGFDADSACRVTVLSEYTENDQQPQHHEGVRNQDDGDMERVDSARRRRGRSRRRLRNCMRQRPTHKSRTPWARLHDKQTNVGRRMSK